MSQEYTTRLPALALAGALAASAAQAQDDIGARFSTIAIDDPTFSQSFGTITAPSSKLVDDDIAPYVPAEFGLQIDHDNFATKHFSLGWTRTPRDNSARGGFYFTDGFALSYTQSSGTARLNVGRGDLDIRGYVRDSVIREMNPLCERHLSGRNIVSRPDFDRAVNRLGNELGGYIADHPELGYADIRGATLPRDGIPQELRPHLQNGLDSLQGNESLMRGIEEFQSGLRELNSYSHMSRDFQSYILSADYVGEVGYTVGKNPAKRGTDLFVDWQLGVGGTIYATKNDEYMGCGGLRGSVGAGARHYVTDRFSATAGVRGTLPIQQKCIGGATYKPDVNPTVYIGAEIKF